MEPAKLFRILGELARNDPSSSAMLPIFCWEASTLTVLRHCFEVTQAAVPHFNPGQIPVITVDQPLFAKMKQLQLSMDRLCGADKFVILLGDFTQRWPASKSWVISWKVLVEWKLSKRQNLPLQALWNHSWRHPTLPVPIPGMPTCIILLKKAYDACISQPIRQSSRAFQPLVHTAKGIKLDSCCTGTCIHTCLELKLLVLVCLLPRVDFDL